jgi:hypothetical protein
VGNRGLAFPPVDTSGFDWRVSEEGVLSNLRKHRYSLIRSHLRYVTNSIELFRFLLAQ